MLFNETLQRSFRPRKFARLSFMILLHEQLRLSSREDVNRLESIWMRKKSICGPLDTRGRELRSKIDEFKSHHMFDAPSRFRDREIEVAEDLMSQCMDQNAVVPSTCENKRNTINLRIQGFVSREMTVDSEAAD